MTSKFIFLTVIFLFYGLYVNAQTSIYIKKDNYEGVIFNSKYWYPLFKNKQRFMPSYIEIKELEIQLNAKINELYRKYRNKYHPEPGCQLVNQLRLYKRQYFGYIDNHKKIIFVSFFKTNSSVWKEKVIITMGEAVIIFSLNI